MFFFVSVYSLHRFVNLNITLMVLYQPMEYEKLTIAKHIVVTSPIFCFRMYLTFPIVYCILFSDKSRTWTQQLNNYVKIGQTKSNIFLFDCFSKTKYHRIIYLLNPQIYCHGNKFTICLQTSLKCLTSANKSERSMQ